MNDTLLKYIDNSKDPIANFELANWYEKNEHFSPASSLYLRCADFSNDDNLIYESLIRSFICYDILGRRDHTCKVLLNQALVTCPKRPEAYYLLSQFYSWRKDYLNAYTYSSLGLSLASFDLEIMKNTKYNSKIDFYFEKANSAWNIGKAKESKAIYKFIFDTLFDKLDFPHKKVLVNNLIALSFTGEDLISKEKLQLIQSLS